MEKDEKKVSLIQGFLIPVFIGILVGIPTSVGGNIIYNEMMKENNILLYVSPETEPIMIKYDHGDLTIIRFVASYTIYIENQGENQIDNVRCVAQISQGAFNGSHVAIDPSNLINESLEDNKYTFISPGLNPHEQVIITIYATSWLWVLPNKLDISLRGDGVMGEEKGFERDQTDNSSFMNIIFLIMGIIMGVVFGVWYGGRSYKNKDKNKMERYPT